MFRNEDAYKNDPRNDYPVLPAIVRELRTGIQIPAALIHCPRRRRRWIRFIQSGRRRRVRSESIVRRGDGLKARVRDAGRNGLVHLVGMVYFDEVEICGAALNG